MTNRDTRDIIGGVLMVAIGLFAAIYAQRYEFGALNRMGPGYFPVALGVMLALLGLLIAVPAFFRPSVPGDSVRWKVLLIITASVVFFALTLKPLGVLFSTAIAVLISTLADPAISWKTRGKVSAGVAALTWLVFVFGLNMVLPTWPWSN
jgi:hypothetical protein